MGGAFVHSLMDVYKLGYRLCDIWNGCKQVGYKLNGWITQLKECVSSDGLS